MQLAVAGRNGNATVFSYSGGFNRSSCYTHDRQCSFLNVSATKITRRLRRSKWIWPFANKFRLKPTAKHRKKFGLRFRRLRHA
jgi:hypothetical protein